MQKLASKCQCKYEAVAQTARMPIGAKCLVQQELVQKNSHVHCLSGQQATLWNTCNCPPPPPMRHMCKTALEPEWRLNRYVDVYIIYVFTSPVAWDSDLSYSGPRYGAGSLVGIKQVKARRSAVLGPISG